MTRIIIEPATNVDANACAGILSSWIDDTPWMPRIHSHETDLKFVTNLVESGRTIVARQNDTVSGFLHRDDDEITALYVARDARRQNIGTHLLRHTQGVCDRLGLWTFQANTAAQKFYEKAGFKATSRTDGDNEENLPDIRFEWQRAPT